ncbi:hypothetical protein BU16DRAFT_528502 [Lophium mytilinum]|uniref:Chromatin remodeling factor mit1 n=1 Tax=Lophium mytilinum TaxID=390894 RepID=A0A6A6QLF9_9PEZI|nr:hypothetical protein BU16DRAFT_528502 [Lophium mytilinum]
MFISDPSSSESDEVEVVASSSRSQVVRRAIAVEVTPLKNPEEFEYYSDPEDVVEAVLRDYEQSDGTLMYAALFTDGRRVVLPFEQLIATDDGPIALEKYNNKVSSEEASGSGSEAPAMDLRPARKSARQPGYLDISKMNLSGDEDELIAEAGPSRRTRGRQTSTRSRSQITVESISSGGSESSEARPIRGRPTRGRAARNGRSTRTAPSGRSVEPRRSERQRNAPRSSEEDMDELQESSDSMNILRSDVTSLKRKRGRTFTAKDEKIPRTGYRQSDRSTRAQKNMQEAGLDDVYRSDSERSQPNAPKVVSVKEVFKPIPSNNPFRTLHVDGCETCGKGTQDGPLVHCQGCSLSYHKSCLGNRSGREHLVTKIGDGDFVLQCRRCVNVPQRKDPTAPDLSLCQECQEVGAACSPFRERTTTAQEQKERNDNGGEDPITNVDPRLVNQASNVLFRCMGCWRAFHYHHLPALSAYTMDISRDEEETAEERFHEYSKTWRCKDCDDNKDRTVSGLIAWRPVDVDEYYPGTPCATVNEDDKQYLVKWEKQSYFRATWQSGAWTWGVTGFAMRKAFNNKDQGAKMRTEDAIPEEFLRIDIVLDVKFTSYVDVRTEDIDKARIKEVDTALMKYKGLGYEDAVWEKVPTSEDGDRWIDFVTAYNDWVAGRYVKIPKQGPMKARLDKARAVPFSKLEKQKQPENLIGGELMKYQIEGLNWLYYQWHSLKNGILADEMGLGKTIQVIAFLATLVQDHNCFPFLVVVPNSTCANWRREIKQWAPALRVVTYFGSSKARSMAYQYEMYPEKSKDLRCHVVVTSYDAAADDSCRKFFRGVSWAGLIVDEGQRLKNDKSQLYAALNAVRAPFRVLLTGTPLQNNARELFNLLQFLDDTNKAAELEEEYAEMTNENIKSLHDLIRPYILRRTKAQVLTFLPPMGQIIVPISMSVLQKQVYKSILSKSPDLLKALFSTAATTLNPKERASLSNILIQLRKCLCHPFVYSRAIEERTDVATASHRNLVEASAKLQLLDLLLPKLKERGHRVLIFSQFLDMLDIMEDFLDGLQMQYGRLDGSIGSLEKQKRIDKFNAPDSPLFAFLLSTRAGGVGINLATADTVIILDPDFNPHQDIQALSRAHRIGQKKKVLCFQFMIRASAEEKIVQIGRKKMALDHVVVEQLDADDMEEHDVESVLKHGAAELFKDDGTDHDIRYDDASIDKLLDRSQIENTKAGEDDSAESQFSFARVWANDQGTLLKDIEAPDETPPDPSVWEKILKEREATRAAEALARAEAFGRGKRVQRGVVNYNVNEQDANGDGYGVSPAKPKGRKKALDESSDTDFQAEHTDVEDADESPDEDEPVLMQELVGMERTKKQGGIAGANYSPKHNSAVKPFVRSALPIAPPLDPYMAQTLPPCQACRLQHPPGACSLKLADVEHCGLCGMAHYGTQRTCPHIHSETQVRDMLEALKNSTESRELVENAAKYLRGVKGTLVQKKKRDREKAQEKALGVGTGNAGAGVAAANGHAYGQGQGTHSASPLHVNGNGSAAENNGTEKAGSMRSSAVPPPASPLVQRVVQSVSAGMGAGVEETDEMDEGKVESALRGFLGK